MSQQLHIYRCSFCDTIATSGVKTAWPPILCCACRRIMAYQSSEDVTSDRDRALLARGVVYNPFDPPRPPVTTRRCDAKGCHNHPEKADMIYLPGVGRFCSAPCADAGAAEHEAFMRRIGKLYDDMPWLRPTKEVARG